MVHILRCGHGQYVVTIQQSDHFNFKAALDIAKFEISDVVANELSIRSNRPSRQLTCTLPDQNINNMYMN